MEFFRIIDKQVSETLLQNEIFQKSLENFTESMFILEKGNTCFKGATFWGEFNISYDKIKGIVRFTLLDCPNALTWTVTTGFPPEETKLYCMPL